MLKGVATTSDGRSILILGLNFGNLDRFRSEPGQAMIEIKGTETGLPIDVIIFSGETEAHLSESINALIGPETKIHIDPKLKS